jgi:hypothetical protein
VFAAPDEINLISGYFSETLVIVSIKSFSNEFLTSGK